MNRIYIWITLPDGETAPLGEFIYGAMSGGETPTAFRYRPEWLQHPKRFALTPDPQGLILDSRQFDGNNLAHPFQVLDDALPDRWGQRLLAVQHRLSRQEQTPFRFMELIGAGGMGALSFTTRDKEPSRRPEAEGVIELETLLDAAQRYEAGEEVANPLLMRLCVAGATAGGARPKAKIAYDGRQWLAKFPSRNMDDGQDVVGLEAVCMMLAKKAGLDAPEVRLTPVGDKRRVLLVERFDITHEGGRRHMVSLRTLCREGHAHVTSYEEPMAAVRRFTDDPNDIHRFFRQAVFNVAIGNTDDHLKNFSMYHDDEGWRLTKPYDLVTDIGHNRSHQMSIGTSFDTPAREELLQVGKAWLGNQSKAEAIVDEVVSAVREFPNLAERLSVQEKDVRKFTLDIAERSRRLAGG